MAEGDTFSLAIPILANIYSGLRQIHDCTSSLGHSNACFPIHYVHGWLALYFNTYYKAPTSLRGPRMVEFSGEGGAKYYTNLEARTHIHMEKYVSWHACLQAKNKDELLTDDGTLIHWNASFFISIRFCFLFSQYGSSTVIEPYSPCRFGRQFGFYQDVPYDLGKKIPKANLANTWWLAKHGDYLQDGLQNLIDRLTPLLIKSKTTKKIEHNPDSGNKKICSSKLEEQPVEKAKKGTKCLVATSTPSAQFKFAARSVANNVRKDLLILTTGKRPSTHTEDSHSSNDDHHWKRPKRPDKQSIDDEKPPIEVLDVA
uniref:Aminotransferase-like plant mobile domain-containing protein n=1 Tax=Cucumis melo TaxID=3656 RepID=A0A9I9CV10_CUCME